MKDYYVLNMVIFLTKINGFATGGLYSPTGAVLGTFFILDGCALFHLFWTDEL